MPYTVMLVDNEAIIPRGLMCLIDWKAHNCCVRAIANDGVDAVHQIQESPPDILITDIRMPEMDGLQLCGWVREHYPGIQMILLTGFPDFEYAQQAIQCGVTDFVLKPTTEKALSAAVDKACQRLQKESRVQKSLLLEQQALLGELIFQSRHSLLYILNKLNDLHIVLPSYYVLSLGWFSGELWRNAQRCSSKRRRSYCPAARGIQCFWYRRAILAAMQFSHCRRE